MSSTFKRRAELMHDMKTGYMFILNKTIFWDVSRCPSASFKSVCDNSTIISLPAVQTYGHYLSHLSVTDNLLAGINLLVPSYSSAFFPFNFPSTCLALTIVKKKNTFLVLPHHKS